MPINKNLLFFLSFLIVLPCYGENQEDSGNQGVQENINLLKSKVSEYEGIVNSKLNRLNSCRSSCVSQCRQTCISNDEDNNEECQGQCTNERCDRTDCSGAKQKHTESKNHLDAYKEQLATAEKQFAAPKEDNQSVVKKIGKGKNKTNAMAFLGVATTAFLGYKAKTCCSQTPMCGMCAVWIGMTGLAGWQTIEMFNQRDKFHDTQTPFCEKNPSSKGCEPDGGPPEMPPSCSDPAQKCGPLLTILDPPPGKSPKATPPPLPCADGSDCFTGGGPNSYLSKISPLYEPKRKWPGGRNPFEGNQKWSYDQATPAQKKEINKVLGQLRNQNKAYMDEAGLTESELESGDDEGVAIGDEDRATASSNNLAGTFTGGGDKNSGSSDYTEGMAPPESGDARRKNKLAQQMKNMLKNFYGNKDGSGKNDLGKKSVSFGPETVGVVEDNIFMMVHRRHRALDDKGEQNFFIKDGF